MQSKKTPRVAGRDTSYDNHIAKVRPIVERYDGEYLVRSENIRHVAGEWTPDRAIVIRSPNMQTLQTVLLPLRTRK